MDSETDESPEGRGITDQDLARIKAYLHMRPSERTPEDLRPPSEN